MKIPTQFKLGVHTITVKKGVRLKDAHGEWRQEEKMICLAKPRKEWSEHFYAQVFAHEVAHCVLDHMGRPDLSENEGFVDGISKAVLQIMATLEFNE